MSLKFDGSTTLTNHQFYDDYMGGLNRETQYTFPEFEKEYHTAMVRVIGGLSINLRSTN